MEPVNPRLPEKWPLDCRRTHDEELYHCQYLSTPTT